jgi:hypothetical protein
MMKFHPANGIRAFQTLLLKLLRFQFFVGLCVSTSRDANLTRWRQSSFWMRRRIALHGPIHDSVDHQTPHLQTTGQQQNSLLLMRKFHPTHGKRAFQALLRI